MYLIYVVLIDQNLLFPFLLSSDSKIKERASLVLTFVVLYLGVKLGFPTVKDCELNEFENDILRCTISAVVADYWKQCSRPFGLLRNFRCLVVWLFFTKSSGKSTPPIFRSEAVFTTTSVE